MAGGHNFQDKWADGPWTLADPGTGNAITMNGKGRAVMGITTAAASETNTLPDPVNVGYELILQHRTDGGSRIITAATAINEANNNTITLTDVDEAICLVSVWDGASSGYRWQVAWNVGATLSTV